MKAIIYYLEMFYSHFHNWFQMSEQFDKSKTKETGPMSIKN